eukprot:357849-Chlamydomonas_euryale.AAC.1
MPSTVARARTCGSLALRALDSGPCPHPGERSLLGMPPPRPRAEVSAPPIHTGLSPSSTHLLRKGVGPGS